MKSWFLNFCRILTGAFGFSVVSACDEGSKEYPAPMYGPPCPVEYGTPHAEFVVKGKVYNEAGNPVKGIAVTPADTYADTCFTDAEGHYELLWSDFPSDKVNVKYTDVDFEDNGGYFMPQTKEIKVEKQKDGQGWYSGLFAAFGVDVNLIENMPEEYGVPYATFEVKGKVTDADDNPLNGIEIYADGMYDSGRTYSAEDGSFSLIQNDWFPSEELTLCFSDVDGEENGGDFGTKKEILQMTQIEEGEGWYDGVYSSDEVIVKM